MSAPKVSRQEYLKQYRAANREHRIALIKDWRQRNPGYSTRYKEYRQKWEADHKEEITARKRKTLLWRKYKITPEQWQALYDSQQGKCAICSVHQSQLKRILQTDHNHSTGEVRGLLCAPCNKAIGMFKDSPDRLQSAIKYLTLLRKVG